MQQLGQAGRVMNVGCSERPSDNLALTIDSHMGLHPEISLVAFLGLAHLRIAVLVLAFVEKVALIIVASTMVPRLTLIPWRCKYS